MESLMNGLGLPVLISVLIAAGAQFVRNDTDSAFLKQNIEATQELSKTMKALEIKIGVFGERYVTRDELERKMKEWPHGA